MKLNSPDNSHFSMVPSFKDLPRSSFSRSSGLKTTLNTAGYIYPIFVDEVLPGDTFNLKMNTFGRLSTPVFPIMDNVYIDYHAFFCPNRLVWENWERFNGAQPDPNSSTSFLVPQTAEAPGEVGFVPGTIYDYMGLPSGGPGTKVNAMPFRMYNLIWNEWYRNQNLSPSATVLTGDADDPINTYQILPRQRRKDYFSSCLPWPHKGPAVPIPLSGKAPITSDVSSGAIRLRDTTAGTVGFLERSNTSDPTPVDFDAPLPGAAGEVLRWPPKDSVSAIGQASYANLSDIDPSTMSTINALRNAVQITRLYERDARGGTRYTEILRAHFGVISPDARLQRPEYLGGSSSPINVYQVPQTSGTQEEGDQVTPQGNLAGYGTHSSRMSFLKTFVEHGFIIILASIRADSTYQQGYQRFWNRRTRWDYYWPELSHIGEQAVLNQEIFIQASSVTPNGNTGVIGYQEPYADYRYKPSMVTGLMRSNVAGSLDQWHLAMTYPNLPTLAAICQEDPPLSRVLAVPSEPAVLLDCYFDLKCARRMPTFAVPGLMDHF